MDNETLKNNILNEIWKLQTGHYDRSDIQRFDPAITGCGVSIVKLGAYISIVDVPIAVRAIKELSNEGSLLVIDPDAVGLISFRATETVTQRAERLLTQDLSRYEVKMVYNIT